MKLWLTFIFATFLLGGCAELWGGVDTVLTYKDKVTNTALENGAKAADKYCQLKTPQERADMRSRFNGFTQSAELRLYCPGDPDFPAE